MNDPDIRQALGPWLRWQYPDARRLDELPLIGCRADVVMVDTAIHGIEIKGDADSVKGKRFAAQLGEYRAVCDTFTLVVGPKHLCAVHEWCRQQGYGLLVATEAAGAIRVRPELPAQPFTAWPDVCQALHMLRGGELLHACRFHGFKESRLKCGSMIELLRALDAPQIREIMVHSLRVRRFDFGWRDAVRDAPLNMTLEHQRMLLERLQ